MDDVKDPAMAWVEVFVVEATEDPLPLIVKL